jgi:putative endonuclease
LSKDDSERVSNYNQLDDKTPSINATGETMKAWLYILHCADGSYYTSSTNNLPLRLAQHQAGEGSMYTRSRLPVKLVYTQEFPSKHDAFLRERQVKGWSRAKKAALIRGDFEALIGLSRSRSSLSSNDCGSDSELPCD